MARPKRIVTDGEPAFTCVHCRRQITTEYLHATAVVTGTRGSTPKRVMKLPGDFGLCRDCAGSGVSFAVQIEWREVGG